MLNVLTFIDRRMHSAAKLARSSTHAGDPQKKLTKSTRELVTLALYRLGGAQRAIDTEDVAMEAHRIGPGWFSWKKYLDQINLELVRINLVHAKENGLAIGLGRTGWRLTQKGLKWAEQAPKMSGDFA